MDKVLQATQIQISITLFIGSLGLILIAWALSNLRNRHWFKACCYGGSGSLLIVIASLFLLILSNLYTYQRLAQERPIAELKLSQLAPQHFQAKLSWVNQKQDFNFDLKGDEWQIDARILKWKYPIIWLGLDSHFQLDRISGRYRDIILERKAERTVYPLYENPQVDLWPLIREYQEYLPWIDALYGSASYLPMRDGGRYTISISQTGIIARAINKEAKEGITTWY